MLRTGSPKGPWQSDLRVSHAIEIALALQPARSRQPFDPRRDKALARPILFAEIDRYEAHDLRNLLPAARGVAKDALVDIGGRHSFRHRNAASAPHFTVTVPIVVRAWTAGEYMSSTTPAGKTKVPCVTARTI